MRWWRCGFALLHVVGRVGCLAALAAAVAVGGCSGGDGERVYGYQAMAPESTSFDVSGRSSRLSPTQQDAIIARAIAAHEMRRP